MSRKKKEEDFEEERESFITRWFGADSEHIVIASALFLLTLLLILSAVGGAGLLGRYIQTYLTQYLGYSWYALLIIFLLSGIALLKRHASTLKVALGAFVSYLASFLLIQAVSPTTPLTGSLGSAFYSYTSLLIGPIITILVSTAVLLIGLAVLLNTNFTFITKWIGSLFERNEEEATSDEYDENEDDSLDEDYDDEGDYEEEDAEDETYEQEDIEDDDEEEEESEPLSRAAFSPPVPYTTPPINLLEKDSGKPRPGDIKANANLIKRTLANFGINVEMDEVSIGPSITRYAMKPAEGVKLSKIVALQDNLAMALAAHPLRIEAPIPGKSLVGIEIPNTTRTTVGLGSLLSSKEFQASAKHLPFALGRNIAGAASFADLAKAPHILVAGATGSGKSVTIHCMIQSLLYQHGPSTLRFLMIDPKRVELTLYNKIPHLLTPVITDAKKSILALKWAGKEMERRYDILESHAVRDIQSYHENILAEGDPEDELEPLPYIVVVIDELADLMTAYPRELEAAIVRLAQKSRAVGIHLIISTQRPSTDVITGLIKANIPARIALQVPSQIDSRTILDMPGAEKLLGAGDMLYLGGDMSKPIRVQCGYISEKEVKRVVDHIAKHSPSLPDDVTFSETSATDSIFASATISDDAGDEDDLYEEAREIIIQAGKASTSYLQRRLKIGYSRAARLIDMLEDRGVVGPAEGSKPREVYVDTEDRQLDDDED